MALSAEISESIPPTLEMAAYPTDEGSDHEAGKFDDKPDNRIQCLMTRKSSHRANLSLAVVVQFLRQDSIILIVYNVNRPSSS